MKTDDNKKLTQQEKLRIKKALKKKRNRMNRALQKQSNNTNKKDNLEHVNFVERVRKTMEDAEKHNKEKESASVVIENSRLYDEYKEIIERFNTPKEVDLITDLKTTNTPMKTEEQKDIEEDKEELTKKQLKKKKRMDIAQLKVLVQRPELVESWDITASDPLLLLHLKSYKNTVEVPKNWNIKKKSIYDKKGLLKKTFKLPDFIENTGIAKLRDPMTERSSLKMIRQKLKERMNPRLGKIDIDYEVLHDAFFKYQTKPHMTVFGDIYYDGKEEDQRIKAYKPGHLSQELRLALGISSTAAPPWLMNMQKFGLPPSYPNLTIPGLSTDIAQLVGFRTTNDFNEHEELDLDKNYLWGTMKEEEESGIEHEEEERVENRDREGEGNEYMNLEEFGAYEYEDDDVGNFEDVMKEIERDERNDDKEELPYKMIDTRKEKNKEFMAADYTYNLNN